MGKFAVKKVPTGIKFDLHAANGETILSSEVYSSEEACEKGIASVKHNAPIAHVEDQTVEGYQTLTNPKFEIYHDHAGECRFRLRARNGENIGASEGYKSKESCKKGIESVVKNAPDAEIIKP